jgi:dynein intermediate chain 1
MSNPDMFAVSYGSYSFIHPVLDGMVVIYSLRNPSYPEQAWLAPKGAMSVDIHPQKNCLVAVGLYDGNVAILNLKKNEQNEPKTIILRNIPTEIKHRASVWSVRWGADDFDGNPNFYSAGMDGRIIHWTVGVQDLQGLGGLNGTEVSTLHLPLPPVQGPDGTTYKLFGCARCLAFHPKEKTTFLVGTAEGNIFRCSSLYGSRFPQIYNAHFLPVATVQWNHFHPEVFISCSEDWTIKIWDRRDPEPMYVFEIGLPILDVSWAPYSSTVFAGVTDEGKVLVYDLNVNKDKPICVQQVVTKKKVHPHRLSFNPHYPIIIIGDDRGHLTTLKLSPNLRILPRDTRNLLLEGEQKVSFEINKMAKLLSLVRDPESINNPKTVPGAGGDGAPGSVRSENAKPAK